MAVSEERAALRTDANQAGPYPYEDADRTVGERVDDLLGRMTLQEKAGLLFHHMITPDIGVPLTEPPSSFTGEAAPAQRVTGPLLNHFNVTRMTDAPNDMARWYNHVQELAVSTRLGIPVTLSSDPRHHFTNNPAIGWRGGPFSQWPEPLGFAAIGEEAFVGHFAEYSPR